jgi:hypothetical protein
MTASILELIDATVIAVVLVCVIDNLLGKL